MVQGGLAGLSSSRGPANTSTQLSYQHGGTLPQVQPAARIPPANSTLPYRPQGIGRGSNPNWKRLSEVEWKAKRDKGLCFRCDEKYTIGHKCKNRELQVMMIYDEEVEEEDGEGEQMREGDGEPILASEHIELSMNSVVGLTTPQTMKLRGDIERQPMVVLIDEGATHNFFLGG